MAAFRYEVLRDNGERLSGKMEAESATTAIRELGNLGYHVLDLKEGEPSRFRIRQKLGRRQVVFFTRQLANLVRGGVPLAKAVSILEGQFASKSGTEIIRNIRTAIQEGKTFSESLELEEKSFSRVYVSLVRSGEASGTLDAVLTHLARLLQRQAELRGRVRSALTYPALMFAMGVVTVLVLLTFVIPKITEMFTDVGRQLPLPTRMLISVSGFFRDCWWLVLAVVVVSFAAFQAAYRVRSFRLMADQAFLRIPLVGGFLLKVEMARLCRVLGSLLKNGVTMLESLDITSSALSNSHLGKTVQDITENVRQGEALSREMSRKGEFVSLMTNVVAVGEESGRLDECLMELADQYDEEVERTVGTLMSLMEPLLIIGVGSVVGFIVLALLLPIIDLNEVIQ